MQTIFEQIILQILIDFNLNEVVKALNLYEIEEA